MRTNHSAATRPHRVSRALSSTKNPMNSAEPRNHDRILWLGLLALLLAAACGTSANPGPGTPDTIRTYRIRRLADSPVARNGHVAIGLADGSALVMGGNSSEAINLPDSSSTQRFDPTTEAFTAGPDARPERARPGVHLPSPAPCGCVSPRRWRDQQRNRARDSPRLAEPTLRPGPGRVRAVRRLEARSLGRRGGHPPGRRAGAGDRGRVP